MCAVATGPNSIPGSPDWGKKLLGKAVQETAEGRDVGENQRPLVVQSHAATTVQNEERITRNQDQGTRLAGDTAVASCQQDTSSQELRWWRENGTQEDTTSKGTLRSVGMTAMLRVEVAGSNCEALLDTGASRSFISPGAVERLQLKDVNQQNGGTQGVRQRTPAEKAYNALARQKAGMTKEEATALLRPPPKRYKTPTKGRRKAVVATLIQQAMERAACIHHPFQGLYAMLALPAVETNVALRLAEERQGALCCVLVETSHSNPQQQRITAPPASALPDEEETSPWSTSKLEYSQFDAWLPSVEAQATPRAILDVLCAHRAVFPDKLPTGLPPKRPHDHRILLVPGKLPTKSAIYRTTPEQLRFHKQEIAKLSANGWIGPTYSPICAPTIMVHRRSDGTGQRFHQIKMAKEDMWKTAFRSVMGLFEYKAWPEVLENETQIRQFLGTVKYCRMFMGPDFARVAHPLVDLTRKGVPVQWTDAHTQAVRHLKQHLIDYITLQIPDTTKPFELYTDASGYAIGAVLEQAGQPIGFLSQAMTPTQQKYSIYDQELLALVSALDKWAHLLRPTKATAHTDHQALTHLQQLKASKPLRGRTARWLDFLAEFPDLTITYLPGARNQVADALSRLPCHSAPCPPPSPIDLPETPSGSLAVPGLATDPPEPPHKTRGTHTDYRKLAGFRRCSSRKRSPSPPVPPPTPTPNPVPESSTPADPPPTPSSPVLDWPAAYSKCPVFSEPYHAASTKPGEVVQLEFQHRRHTFRFVLPYLHICVNGLWHICVPQFPEFLTHVLYTHHDHVTAGHRGQNKTYKALSKHYYWPGMRTYTNAKMAHFIPAKKSHSAADTVELLADRLIRYHGFPDVLVSDRDPCFQSEVWSQLCSRFNITRAMSSSYHPQTDGQTERVNRTLEQMLRTYIQADEREWEGLLPALELAYNTTSHSSTELSPFEIMIGENPLTAADLDIVGALAPTLTPPMTKLFRQLCDRAQSHILQAKWLPHEAPVGWPPTRDKAGNSTDQYLVDYILDQKGTGEEAYYLVKWRGLPEEKATWEPAHHLTGCPALLRAWRRRQRKRRPS
ncbi:hypothetical protein EBH_0033500 [Eimeria brunetti]|uniref:RNA-directed DNA polymerase n=1 Tax=Eimeria brunetti TaxID=51314 RepID=U6LJT0_9EIME|nr:hypothetical protein EBH_0033500 [Eimeria brunetti]